MLTLYSEMASWWLRTVAVQMQYWQDAADKWQASVGRMAGMLPKVDPRGATSSPFAPELFQAPWMAGWMKAPEANTALGAWPMPVRHVPDAAGDTSPVAVPKPDAPARPKPAAQPPAPAASAAVLRTAPETDAGIPPLLEAAPAEPDDLLKLKGVGPKILKLLNDLGIYSFAQIAAWTPDQISWIESKLDFKGRVTREDWVAQAKKLSDRP